MHVHILLEYISQKEEGHHREGSYVCVRWQKYVKQSNNEKSNQAANKKSKHILPAWSKRETSKNRRTWRVQESMAKPLLRRTLAKASHKVRLARVHVEQA